MTVVYPEFAPKVGTQGVHFPGPLQPQIRSCGEDSRPKPEMHFQIAREGLSGVTLDGFKRLLF